MMIERQSAILRAITQVVRSGRFGGDQNPWVGQFEREIARLFGFPYAISANSATSALHAALVGVGVKPGDEVLVPTLSFLSVGQAVLHAGAIPVFVDADPLTWTMDPRDAARKVTRRTAALMPVHLFGVPCDMKSLMALAKTRGLKVVEDCAQSFLARSEGKLVGTFGEAGVFSFGQVKHLKIGGAGVMVTRDGAIARRVRKFAHLRPDREVPVAHNFRITAFQAAVGLAQLPWASHIVGERVRSARKLLSRVGIQAGVVPQWIPEGVEPVFFRAAVLKKGTVPFSGKGWKQWYPPLHREPVFRAFARKANCPVADRLNGRLWAHPLVSPQ